MRLYRIEPDGRETHYHTAILADAAVKGGSSTDSPIPIHPGRSDLEEVTFAYQQITLTNMIDGVEHSAVL